MTENNVDRVMRWMGVFDRADWSLPLDDYIDPEVTVDWSESHAPYGGVYSGHQGWVKLFAELRDAFENSEIDVHEYIVSPPHVAVRNTVRLSGRDGIAVQATSTLLWTFRDDKIIALRLFQQHADALKVIDAGVAT